MENLYPKNMFYAFSSIIKTCKNVKNTTDGVLIVNQTHVEF